MGFLVYSWAVCCSNFCSMCFFSRPENKVGSSHISRADSAQVQQTGTGTVRQAVWDGSELSTSCNSGAALQKSVVMSFSFWNLLYGPEVLCDAERAGSAPEAKQKLPDSCLRSATSVFVFLVVLLVREMPRSFPCVLNSLDCYRL